MRAWQAGAGPSSKMKRKDYEREVEILHGQLVAMQEWIRESGAKICVVFEGRELSTTLVVRDSTAPPGPSADA